jgi:glycosyltransferase involved in cell wall biosynthesis
MFKKFWAVCARCFSNRHEAAMTPALSIVIPNRNSGHTLPRLFDSILRQSLKAVEVVLVDDASDFGYAEVLEGYRHKGLTVSFIPSSVRLYTKNARLSGVRAAQAEIIAFADADDMLWGAHALEENVALYHRHKADVVQFRSVHTDAAGNFLSYRTWGDPLAPELAGAGIFSAFVRQGTRGHTVWNKLYSKALWLEIMDVATAGKVIRYAEDAYLASLYMFHARRYIGSEHIGYGYYLEEKRRQESAERAVYHYFILRELLPYFAARGCPNVDMELFALYMGDLLRIYAGRLAVAAYEGGGVDAGPCGEAVALFGKKTLLKALLVGAQMNASRVVSAAHALTIR